MTTISDHPESPEYANSRPTVVSEPYTTEIMSSVTQISPEDWARVAPSDDPVWTWSFFQAMENGRLGPDSFAYVVIRSQHRIVAILPTFIYSPMRLDHVAGDVPRWLLAPIRALFPPLLRLHVMFCGNLLGQGRILTEVSGDPHLAELAARAAVLHARQSGGRCVVFKDFTAADLAPLRSVFRDHGFFDVPGLPDAVIPLSCSSFDQYIADLRAKPRRNARRKIRRFTARSDLRLEVVEEFEHLVDPMLTLYNHVLARADHRLDIWTPEMLSALATDPAIDASVVTCRQGNRLVGFLLCLVAGSEVNAIRIGLDYSMAQDAFIYHNLHYGAIEFAMARGCKTINLAQTHYIPKLEMGARLLTRTNTVMHVNPLVRVLLRRFLRSALQDSSLQSSQVAQMMSGRLAVP